MRLTNRKTHFTDRKPLLSLRSIRTYRHIAYTDRYGAGVLDNPHIRNRKTEGKIIQNRKKIRPKPKTAYKTVKKRYNGDKWDIQSKLN